MARAYKRSGPAYGVRRRYSAKRRASTSRSALVAKGRMPVPGYTRTSGSWGRFSGNPGELKFHDIHVTETGFLAVGAVRPVISSTAIGIAAGTSPQERVGRKCTIKSINIRGRVKCASSGDFAQACDNVRMILFQDTQANGSVPLVTDLLASTNYNSFNNLDNKQRFRVLAEKTFSINQQAGGAYGYNGGYSVPAAASGNQAGYSVPADSAQLQVAECTRQFSFFHKCSIPLEFSGDTGHDNELRSNNIWLLMISEEQRANYEYRCRVRFTDY